MWCIATWDRHEEKDLYMRTLRHLGGLSGRVDATAWSGEDKPQEVYAVSN